MRRKQFDYIYNEDGSCTNWWCGKHGVVLAYDSFSPECAHWFCEDCWRDYLDDCIPFLDIVEDKRKKELIKK